MITLAFIFMVSGAIIVALSHDFVKTAHKPQPKLVWVWMWRWHRFDSSNLVIEVTQNHSFLPPIGHDWVRYGHAVLREVRHDHPMLKKKKEH